MSITHTFLDFIPSIFLGAPDTDTELSVLPGHELLKQGFGFQALKLCVLGALSGIIIFSVIFLPSILFIEKIYSLIKPFIPYLLILVSLSLVLSEKNKFSALWIFSLTGLLGYLVLNSQSKESLLPLLAGLFGASTLLISIKQKTKIPKQNLDEKINVKISKPLIGSTIVSPLSIFLPALGSGQIAILGSTFSIPKDDKKGFLVLLGATNTLAMAFSFLALFTISKTRTGSAVAINDLVGIPPMKIFILICIIILISGIISYFLSLKIAKYFIKLLEIINYTKISIITLVILIIVVFVFSGFSGLLILIASILTGIYGISFSIRRTNFMGCLIIPTIILYLS
mgnify:FL=1